MALSVVRFHLNGFKFCPAQVQGRSSLVQKKSAAPSFVANSVLAPAPLCVVLFLFESHDQAWWHSILHSGVPGHTIMHYAMTL